MDIDTRCVICNRLDEDGGHLFFKCKGEASLEREMNLEDVRCRIGWQGYSQRWGSLQFVTQLEEKQSIRVAVLLYTWWNERNRRREGEGRRRELSCPLGLLNVGSVPAGAVLPNIFDLRSYNGII